jgi:hypothetical protein
MSSKIYEFIMKCRSCAESVFVIRTNPALQTFDYIKGIQKRSAKEEQNLSTKNPAVLPVNKADGDDLIPPGTIVREDKDNPIDWLERQAHGQRKSMAELQQLETLQKIQLVNWKDDAANNATLRAEYRRKRNAKRKREEDAIKLGLGRGIELPDNAELLSKEAKLSFALSKVSSAAAEAKRKEQKRFSEVRTESIFCRGDYETNITSKGLTCSKRLKPEFSNVKVACSNPASKPIRMMAKSVTASQLFKPSERRLCHRPRQMQFPSKNKSTSLSALADYS